MTILALGVWCGEDFASRELKRCDSLEADAVDDMTFGTKVVNRKVWDGVVVCDYRLPCTWEEGWMDRGPETVGTS